jgi:non-specific serine/threonine protein kinase
MDAGLQKDLAAVAPSGLELAPNAAKSQMVVSAIEGGPTSAPAPAAHKPVPKPTPKPATQLASNHAQAPAPAPQPPIAEPLPSRPSPMPERAPTPERAPAPRQAEPAPLPPLPAQAQGQQKGVYKTEGEVFQKMPWIKP